MNKFDSFIFRLVLTDFIVLVHMNCTDNGVGLQVLSALVTAFPLNHGIQQPT